MAKVDKRGLKRATLEILGKPCHRRSNENEKSEGRTAARCKTINLRFGIFIRLKKKTRLVKKKKEKKKDCPIQQTVLQVVKTRYKVIVHFSIDEQSPIRFYDRKARTKFSPCFREQSKHIAWNIIEIKLEKI